MNRDASTQSSPPSNARFTLALLADLREVLEKHGYVASQNPQAHSGFLVAALELTNTYEGKS